MENKILIIEDNEQDRKIIERFLSTAGFSNILFSTTGEEGLLKAEQEKPDLVVTDTILPDIDGFEVCKRIKDNNSTSSIKIIIITGIIDAVDAVRARKMGADDYCVKTSDLTPLVHAIKKILSLDSSPSGN